MKQSKIDVDDEVICPDEECNMSILVCIKKPEIGSREDWFTWFADDGWGGKKGDKCECPICGKRWMVFFPQTKTYKIHVKDKGWII